MNTLDSSEVKNLKLAFFLYNKKQRASFVETGVIAEISGIYDTKLLLSDEKLELGFDKVITRELVQVLPKLPKSSRKITTFMQCVALWRFKDRSMGHKVRAYCQFGSPKERKEWSSVIVYEMENWSEIKRIFLKVLAMQPFYCIAKSVELCLRNLLLTRYWRSILQEIDIVALPFAGHISYEFSLMVWLCKKMKIKTLAIQENWDNVSSKTFITEEPDFFGVWGEQSKSHLIEIHELHQTRIRILGSPRFEPYFIGKIQDPIAASSEFGNTNLVGRRYVLLAGTGDGIDDEMLIDASYSACLGIKPNVNLIYRPHPFTRYQHNFRELKSKYPLLIFDEGDEARTFGHHIPLVQNASIIISHLSTLVLEGLINEKFVCVPLFLGRDASIEYSRFIDGAQHYIGLRLVGNLVTPSSLEDMKSVINECLSRRRPTSNANLEWICSKGNFTNNLLDVLSEMS